MIRFSALTCICECTKLCFQSDQEQAHHLKHTTKISVIVTFHRQLFLKLKKYSVVWFAPLPVLQMQSIEYTLSVHEENGEDESQSQRNKATDKRKRKDVGLNGVQKKNKTEYRPEKLVRTDSKSQTVTL